MVAETCFPIVLRSFAKAQHYTHSCSRQTHTHTHCATYNILHVVGGAGIAILSKNPYTRCKTHTSADYQAEMTAFPVNIVFPGVCRLLIRFSPVAS